MQVIFAHETGPVVKRFSVTGTDGDAHKREYRRHLLIAMREAERDIAYRLVGDSWGRLVGSFWGAPNDAEIAMLNRASAMRPDLFGVFELEKASALLVTP